MKVDLISCAKLLKKPKLDLALAFLVVYRIYAKFLVRAGNFRLVRYRIRQEDERTLVRSIVMRIGKILVIVR